MKQLVILGLVWLSLSLSAEIIFYKFDDPEKEARFNQLIEELRCPKCQNNNLADSNAPLSVDLKDIIYDQIHQGASDQQIIDYLKARYGDFIYYKPPVRPSTWFIWFGPFVILLAGGVLIWRYLAGRKTEVTEPELVSDANLKLVESWQNESEDKR